MYYFISVNYGTSHLIQSWIESIHKSYKGKFKIIVVDNFKSDSERKKVLDLTKRLEFHVIKSKNDGYGMGLNKGIDYVKEISKDENDKLFVGNLDIVYLKLPDNLPNGKFVYIPCAIEGRRDRNPFLTKLQSKFLFLHKISCKFNSKLILFLVILLIKIIGYKKSPIWTLHGSMFSFNLKSLQSENLFNADTFLYSEELEFGSYMERAGVKFIDTEIKYVHTAHAATSKIINSRNDFLRLWKSSFNNWITRWKSE